MSIAESKSTLLLGHIREYCGCTRKYDGGTRRSAWLAAKSVTAIDIKPQFATLESDLADADDDDDDDDALFPTLPLLQ